MNLEATDGRQQRQTIDIRGSHNSEGDSSYFVEDHANRLRSALSWGANTHSSRALNARLTMTPVESRWKRVVAVYSFIHPSPQCFERYFASDFHYLFSIVAGTFSDVAIEKRSHFA